MVETSHMYEVLVAKPEWKGLLARTRYKWVHYIILNEAHGKVWRVIWLKTWVL
jgi:hypothetical protein